VVIDRETSGQFWPSARLCTPISYKVASIWRPEGWEPGSARDVPNCVWRAQGQSNHEIMSYRQATDTVLSLNQQSIDADGTMWYVVLAVENEPCRTLWRLTSSARKRPPPSADCTWCRRKTPVTAIARTVRRTPSNAASAVAIWPCPNRLPKR
jgi:hypothetical protein